MARLQLFWLRCLRFLLLGFYWLIVVAIIVLPLAWLIFSLIAIQMALYLKVVISLMVIVTTYLLIPALSRVLLESRPAK